MVEMLQSQTTPAAPAVPVADADVPNLEIRPALVPGVVLLGEAQGSGFASTMWLVQIDGRFVQLTELLYRVMEYADGKRTLEEIATEVGRVSEWQMNADDVHFLVVNKLVPIGLVALSPDEPEHPSRQRRDAPSLLQLGLRRRAIGPDTIEPIARVLQVFFNPILMLPLLAAGLVMHGWLYFDHGVNGLISNALYTPGLLLIGLLLSFLPGVWHEFGHAAALRYGGGRARGIGVGIYIMDPAFYTDVTDSYRLGRWARVRTGLGGIYFDMILSVVFLTIYQFTGNDILLLVVVLNNINTIYQFFPLVRLDGYWVLADLTGVPDFYSLMGAFIRSVVPIRAWKGQKLPRLKPWVKVFFSLYTVIALPGLVFFMYTLLRRVPDIIVTAWDALNISARDIPPALRAGEWFDLAALGSQVVLIGITLIGLTYFLVRIARGTVTLLWRLALLIRKRSGFGLRDSKLAP